jgi:hypothetical protein
VPAGPGLGIAPDFAQIERAHELYQAIGTAARDDAAAMQWLVPGWTYDPKRPSLAAGRGERVNVPAPPRRHSHDATRRLHRARRPRVPAAIGAATRT